MNVQPSSGHGRLSPRPGPMPHPIPRGPAKVVAVGPLIPLILFELQKKPLGPASRSSAADQRPAKSARTDSGAENATSAVAPAKRRKTGPKAGLQPSFFINPRMPKAYGQPSHSRLDKAFAAASQLRPGIAEAVGLAALADKLVTDYLPAAHETEVAQQLVLERLRRLPQRLELAQALSAVLCRQLRDTGAIRIDLLIRGVAQILHGGATAHDVARDLGALIGACARAPLGKIDCAWRGVLDNCFAMPEPAIRAMLIKHAFDTWLGHGEEAHVAVQSALRHFEIDATTQGRIDSWLAARRMQEARRMGAPARAWSIERPFAQPLAGGR